MHVVGEKDFKILGRMVAKKHPDIARALLSTYQDHRPYDCDYSNIEIYFTQYCSMFPATSQGHTVDSRRLFIGAMLRIYQPHVYYQPLEEINLGKRGFVTILSEVIGQHKQNTSSYIKQVILWENKNYENMGLKVMAIVEQLKSEIEKAA